MGQSPHSTHPLTTLCVQSPLSTHHSPLTVTCLTAGITPGITYRNQLLPGYLSPYTRGRSWLHLRGKTHLMKDTTLTRGAPTLQVVVSTLQVVVSTLQGVVSTLQLVVSTLQVVSTPLLMGARTQTTKEPPIYQSSWTLPPSSLRPRRKQPMMMICSQERGKVSLQSSDSRRKQNIIQFTVNNIKET